MIVVDTNLLAYLYIGGEHTARSEAALLRDPEWVAPLLWRSELRNVLASHVRLGRLAIAEALRAIDAAETQMSGREFDVVSSRVLTLAADSGCTAYDCEFVALAQDLDVTLVTSDRELVKAFPERVVALDVFVA